MNILFILLQIFVFSAPASTAEKDHCFVVDGPANLRKVPKGEILMSIPDGSTVCKANPDKAVPEWIYVTGYRWKNGKIFINPEPPSDPLDGDFKIGWIHESNRKKVSFDQFLKIDLLGALDNEASGESKPHQTIQAIKDCRCAKFDHPNHDVRQSKVISIVTKNIIGTDCNVYEKVSVCKFNDVSETSEIICPLDCVSSTPTKMLTDQDRIEKFRLLSKDFKQKTIKLISKKLLLELNNKYPDWHTYVLPKFLNDHNYDYLLINQKSIIHEKDREALLFFANITDAFSFTPSIAIEEKSKIIIRRFPFNIKPEKNQIEGFPTICFAKSKPTVVAACRNQDEIVPPIGLFDYLDTTSRLIKFDSLIESKANAGNSCCDSQFIPFDD